MKLVTLFSLIIFSFVTKELQAFEEVPFKGGLWLKESCFQESGVTCLPQALGTSQELSLVRPTFQTPTLKTLNIQGVTVKILWTYHEANIDYQAFQVELFDPSGTQVALCSRYEKIDLDVRHIPVGACAGVSSSFDNRLLGFTIALP